MNWVTIPNWLKRLFPQLVWEIPTFEKRIYLTFDDGPTPQVTPVVLAFLREFNAKATFFCLGSKAEKYPDLIEQIRRDGHIIGNHGYRHLNGFITPLALYIENARKGAGITGSKLFRPPYGRVWPWQIKRLQKEHRIIMWNIMSMDFDTQHTGEECFNNVIKHLSPGSIVVFHDTEQACERLVIFLPKLLHWLLENGYALEKISTY